MSLRVNDIFHQVESLSFLGHIIEPILCFVAVSYISMTLSASLLIANATILKALCIFPLVCSYCIGGSFQRPKNLQLLLRNFNGSAMAARHDHLLSIIRRMEVSLENTLGQLKKEQVQKQF